MAKATMENAINAVTAAIKTATNPHVSDAHKNVKALEAVEAVLGGDDGSVTMDIARNIDDNNIAATLEAIQDEIGQGEGLDAPPTDDMAAPDVDDADDAGDDVPF